jgi:hypothetical protein
MKVLVTTKPRDHEKERSERKRSLPEFLTAYNRDLPDSFPRASVSLLTEFRSSHPSLFREDDVWTLAAHRKKIMDWLPQYAHHSQS